MEDPGTVKIIENDDQYILNHCTKFLSRSNTDARHNFGQYDPADSRGRICESWRFPIIDTYAEAGDENNYPFWARSSAVALPIPLEAPVTNAILWAICFFLLWLPFLGLSIHNESSIRLAEQFLAGLPGQASEISLPGTLILAYRAAKFIL